MKRVVVKYKVKADKAEENTAYIKKVFAELHRNNPAGLRYVSFRLEDGVSFVHLASVETTDGQNPLGQSPAFKAFQEKIKERCE
jgi:hypothetical protein